MADRREPAALVYLVPVLIVLALLALAIAALVFGGA